LSNLQPDCRVSALHFFEKQIKPMCFWHWTNSVECSFQLLIPGLTIVSLLESNSGFEIVTQLGNTAKRSSLHIDCAYFGEVSAISLLEKKSQLNHAC
jgi:hypothetical protein